jgi:hypothetical protein
MIHMPEKFQTFEGVEAASDAFAARMRLLTGDSDILVNDDRVRHALTANTLKPCAPCANVEEPRVQSVT